MSKERDIRWSMAVNSLIANRMTFVNAYKRQEGRLRTIQLIVSPFGRTEKVFYSEEPMLHDANELMKVKLGDHVYQSARELYGNEFDSLKQYVLEYKTHKKSWEDVTPHEWSEIEKELRDVHKRVAIDLSNRLSEYSKVVSEIMTLCDNAFEDCRDFMKDAYHDYYDGVQGLALEFQELIGRPFALDMWGERIELFDFEAFYDHCVKREMSLDEIRSAKRTLEQLILEKQGEIENEN